MSRILEGMLAHHSFPPRLDPRLQRIRELVSACVGLHADIGSDHAHLPIALIKSGGATHVHIVELNSGPLEHAQHNVNRAGYETRITIHQGDGFLPLRDINIESASITGMGAGSIRWILEQAPRLPSRLFLQPNDSAFPLRQWAQDNEFHITIDELIAGHWHYPVLALEKKHGADPIYAQLSAQEYAAALRYGRFPIQRHCPLLLSELKKQEARLLAITPHNQALIGELNDTQTALKWME